MATNTEYKNLDVLIVEDEVDICYLLSGLLRKRNLRTSFVTSLVDGKRELGRSKPDILFIDNHLPDGLGIDFISYVKQLYPLLKIVMITAHDSHDDKAFAIKQGADYFIGKPFTTDTIMHTIDILMLDFAKQQSHL